MSFKMMVLGVAAAGVAGVATRGGFGGGHDAERAIARPPAEVYAAISSISDAGVRETPPFSDGPQMKIEVHKDDGTAMHFRLSSDGKTVGSLDLTVIPDQGGKASRLAADFEVDQPAIARMLGDKESQNYVPAPPILVNLAVNRMLGEIARNVEAGKPLGHFEIADVRSWKEQMADADRASEMREEMQHEAAAPTAPDGTKPAVDPNAEARKYLHGGY